MPSSVSHAIAIDGPVAAGKTSVGQDVAARLGCLFLDTGAIYRALTYAALDAGVPTDDGPALAALAARSEIDVRMTRTADTSIPSAPGYAVLVDGTDVTARLRSREVDASVSAVSSHAAVRDALLVAQRRVAEQAPAVMVGRDIGTIVLPDAGLKVYLVASVEERARRRYRERLARGEAVTWADVLATTAARDAKDSGRDVAPMVQAGDAMMLNTDDLSPTQVVDRIIDLAAEAGIPVERGALA